MTWKTSGTAYDDVPQNEACIVTVGGKEIGLFRVGETLYAILNFCPHFGAPVCEGKVFTGCVTASVSEDGKNAPLGFDASRLVLRCPWHHWEFDMKTGAALAPIRQRLKTYPVKVENGEVWIDV
jgi:nitrite reductase/ring-hydroxylating ferredoxin subunit